MITLRELKEQINYFDAKYDDVPVAIDSYIHDSPIYEPREVYMDGKTGFIRISVEMEDSE